MAKILPIVQKYILIFLVLLIHENVYPQILNMEKHRVERDTGNYSALNVNLGMSIFTRSADEENPVNLFGVNNVVHFLRKQNEHAYIFIHQLNYLRINESPWLNTGFNHLRVHLWRANQRSAEIFVQHSYDNFRQLNPRLVGGVNARFRLIRDSSFSWDLGVGPMYEREFWTHPYTEELVDVDFLKINLYTSLRWKLSENIDLNALVYYQVGYDPGINDARHRIFFSGNLLSKITNRISFNTSFEFNYEDKPIIPITPFIFDIRNGLIFSF
ncbi:MAG: DUF481 domain-containing protein [Flavobacteriales bacterium]|nr:MAG: DUF481 domain-containing protein [Flavobacteriales bacterium]